MADTLTGFLFCVFDSASEEGEERSSGRVYLRNRAEACFLEQILGSLYETHGVSISTSDDAVVSGAALAGLASAIRNAITSVEAQPDSWLVRIGHRFEPFQTGLGPAILQRANRSSLLNFLQDALARIESASRKDGFLHWAGGE